MADISPGPCGGVTDSGGRWNRCTRPAVYVICRSADYDSGERACRRHLAAQTDFVASDIGTPRTLTVHVLSEGDRRARY